MENTEKLKVDLILMFGFTPDFLNIDLGKFTGSIFIANRWGTTPPFEEKIPNIWNKIALIDETLSEILGADITELTVKFEANKNQGEWGFTITFIYD